MPLAVYTGAGSITKHGEVFSQNVPVLVSDDVAQSLNGVANFTLVGTSTDIIALRGKYRTVLSSADIAAHVTGKTY
jgi:hypothetical protein